ncbi:uncharacterized protein N7482_003731 [Penicillium canariense]|uniref:Uncharacterized protein n=1 Tax=Penicillium canariense TaxID=189055 RepID=A0A9W9IAZ0_9EURO|nr:uncharacterized protein N7482_003731 [Penicillium canariense]KAJ5168137.1 hypothetical protein N7482_003731 [Penicillium canariense]
MAGQVLFGTGCTKKTGSVERIDRIDEGWTSRVNSEAASRGSVRTRYRTIPTIRTIPKSSGRKSAAFRDQTPNWAINDYIDEQGIFVARVGRELELRQFRGKSE